MANNLINIDDLRKQFTDKVSVEEWKLFATTQQHIIDTYEKQLDILKTKNRQLESMLMSKSSLITELTPEENICIQQISKLEVLSNERQLTLEEVKRLDLLVKNLKLIREESTIVLNNRSVDLKEAELVAIATSTENDD